MKVVWDKNDNELSVLEGWAIFNCLGSDGGDWQIQRLDSEGIFKDDEEAIAHVLKKAMEGSKLHKKAIAYIHEYNPKEYKFIKHIQSNIKIFV